MKPGDYVRYRDRKSTDPQPPGVWGDTGIVISMSRTRFGWGGYEPAEQYMNGDGEFIVARVADLEIICERSLRNSANHL